ncbi:MAG: DNA primase small subunit-like [Trebouxia sp. A1-2]|nr:MAG: DNA primase small subunit-like [Trebouxia sp. A1-2]
MASDATPGNKRQKIENIDKSPDQDDHDVAMPEAAASPVKAVAGNVSDYSSWSVQQLMKMYYGRLFPHQDMFKWLAYGNDSKHPQADLAYFHKREFCFTLDGDIFVRYQSFKAGLSASTHDGEELRAAINNKLPAKIDIGPVYNVDPKHRNAYAGLEGNRKFMPVERELVFDIDLTDYDDVRTCGKGAHICNKCWPLMAVAIKILDAGLRQDFGFKHILWVFSGRRGVHAWVCDPRARKMSDEARSAVASFLSVHKGQEKGISRLSTSAASKDHPFLDAAYQCLEEVWTEVILPQQQLFESSEHWTAALAHIPDPDVRDKLGRAWSNNGKGRVSSDSDDLNVARWNELVHELASMSRLPNKDKPSKAQLQAAESKAKKDIVFACAYPRLDIEVSKKMNHLLKAPFCVHPKTGKVCVPIDPENAENFDPMDGVPTVSQLLTDLDQSDVKQSTADMQNQWKHTALQKAVADFSLTASLGMICCASNRD